jgi:hypothetical protein
MVQVLVLSHFSFNFLSFPWRLGAFARDSVFDFYFYQLESFAPASNPGCKKNMPQQSRTDSCGMSIHGERVQEDRLLWIA